MRNSTVFGAALAVLAAVTLSACSGSGDEEKPLVSTDASARPAKRVLDQPYAKPDLVLTDNKGEKFDLRTDTAGMLTLVYFGYTHCPDTCPLVVSNVALAYQDLPKAQQDKLRFVFVSTDPERDTPKELDKWLPSAGDPDFIGLTGDFDTVEAAGRAVGVGMAPATKDAEGDVTATHGKTVLAFSPKDDKAHLIYHGDEATAKDYAKDIPKLIRGQIP